MQDYDDRLLVTTPEGVELELPLAGLASRFLAQLGDLAVQGAVVLALAFAAPASGLALATALQAIVLFLVLFAYHPLFEVLASGGTPGKRAAGLRVVRDRGQPVGVTASAIRNLVRLLDLLPAAYAVGSIAILVSRRNQRLGDLAAGTVVVRVRRPERHQPWSSAAVRPALELTATWDVSSLGREQVAVVRRFLERRHHLEPAARTRLAFRLAEQVRERVAGVPADVQGETLLEHVVAAKSAREH